MGDRRFVSNSKGFMFEEKPKTSQNAPYSWTFMDDETAGQSHRITAGWYGSKREAIEAARAWQRDVCEIEVPDDPDFTNTDRPTP